MAGASQGVFGSFGQQGAPGFIDPFAASQVGLGAGTSLDAMNARYRQLGMPGSTPNLQDVGAAPSVTGGIPAQFAAVLGELQNSALRQAPGGSGKQSPANQAGSILNAFSK